MKDWDPEPAQKDCENEDIEVDRWISHFFLCNVVFWPLNWPV
jgi:hypothetical protein